MRRTLVPLIAGLGLAGCGGGGGTPSLFHGHANRSQPGAVARPSPRTGGAAVARGWAQALERGDVDAATRYFAVPAIVENGTPPLALRTRDAVRSFNVALPCGARFLRAENHHGYVLVTFRLVDRRGPGAVRPCQGRGAEAATAFRIRDGKIVEWRRALVPGERARPRLPPAPGSAT